MSDSKELNVFYESLIDIWKSIFFLLLVSKLTKDTFFFS